ncbi:MAG: hypothetical protein ABH950_04675 [Candidatus Altiarchaeota archaeon]
MSVTNLSYFGVCFLLVYVAEVGDELMSRLHFGKQSYLHQLAEVSNSKVSVDFGVLLVYYFSVLTYLSLAF